MRSSLSSPSIHSASLHDLLCAPQLTQALWGGSNYNAMEGFIYLTECGVKKTAYGKGVTSRFTGKIRPPILSPALLIYEHNLYGWGDAGAHPERAPPRLSATEATGPVHTDRILVTESKRI